MGGKLTGAGGGGFMLLFAPPEKHPDILEALNARLHVPFEFDPAAARSSFMNLSRLPGGRACPQAIGLFVQGMALYRPARGGVMNRTARIFVAGAETLAGVLRLEKLPNRGTRTYSDTMMINQP